MIFLAVLMKIRCSVPQRNSYVFYRSTLFQLQLFVQLTDLGSKKPLPIPDKKIPRFLGQQFWVVPWISIYTYWENSVQDEQQQSRGLPALPGTRRCGDRRFATDTSSDAAAVIVFLCLTGVCGCRYSSY